MKKTMKHIIPGLLLAVTMLLCMCSCTQSEKVSQNISQHADNFNVTRKITVANIRDNTILYELIGKCSLKNEGHNELSVISEVSKGNYKKRFHLSQRVDNIYCSGRVRFLCRSISLRS